MYIDWYVLREFEAWGGGAADERHLHRRNTKTRNIQIEMQTYSLSQCLLLVQTRTFFGFSVPGGRGRNKGQKVQIIFSLNIFLYEKKRNENVFF